MYNRVSIMYSYDYICRYFFIIILRMIIIIIIFYF